MTVALIVADVPSTRDNSAGSNSTPVTATVAAFTVTLQVADFPPSFVVTVMVASPAFTAVTLPFLSTVATAVELLDQVTLLSVALEGATVAVSAVVSPSVMSIVCRSRVTPVTLIVVGTAGSFGSVFPQPEIARTAMAKAMNAKKCCFIFMIS